MVKKSRITTVEEARDLIEEFLVSPEWGLTTPSVAACKIVVDTPEFWIAPGSAGNSPHAHHAYIGGLAIHTAQVLIGSVGLCSLSFPDWDANDLVVAVLWHDFGKVYDYDLEKGPYTVVRYGEKLLAYDKTPHYSRINHLPRSYAEFYKRCSPILTPPRVEKISHIILAHHGRKDWGSPIEPASPEAWAIHCADKLSSDYQP
jgi:23S rRNA maturation-related 3'-5' exoribonuclease YhaM